MSEELPVRYCHGCKQHDDHPRVHVIGDANNVATDLLYHWDCVPSEVPIDPEHHAVALEATNAGKRGDEVRAVLAEYAASIPEAPAHTPEEQDAYQKASD